MSGRLAELTKRVVDCQAAFDAASKALDEAKAELRTERDAAKAALDEMDRLLGVLPGEARPLSPKMQRILPLAKAGKRQAEIAEELGLSLGSVYDGIEQLRLRGHLPRRNRPVGSAAGADARLPASPTQAPEPPAVPPAAAPAPSSGGDTSPLPPLLAKILPLAREGLKVKEIAARLSTKDANIYEGLGRLRARGLLPMKDGSAAGPKGEARP